MVQPQQLVGVERTADLLTAFKVKYLIISSRVKIPDRRGTSPDAPDSSAVLLAKTVITILHYADCPVTFGQFFTSSPLIIETCA